MNDIEIYKNYIRGRFINSIERLMGNLVDVEVDQWEKNGAKGLVSKNDATYKKVLHEEMQPYYEMYLNGDTGLCCDGQHLESITRLMDTVIKEDDEFGNWASEQNLIISAECWGDNLKRYEKETKRIFRFFHLLELLLESDCRQDWVELSQTLKEMLFKAEVCSDYKTDEVLCVLHAFTMIMQQEWTKNKKKELLNLLNQNWKFMKHYYSVMTRHPIGVKWTTMFKVAETVMTASQMFKPHMHIFYCGLMDCVDELQLVRKQRRDMDKVVAQMQGELNRCEPSELLYELCDTLFPEDFQRLLREHRPKSYSEVEDESRRKDELISEMRKQNKHLQNELDRTTETLRQMVESSIPIEEIERELLNLQVGVDYAVFEKLTAMLICNAAWVKAAPDIRKRILERQVQPSVYVQNQFGPVNGNVAQQTFPLPSLTGQQQYNNQIEKKG